MAGVPTDTSTAALAEAIEQQIATGDILRLISRFQTDAQPVCDAVVTHAVRLCAATFAFVMLHRRGRLTLVARTACTDAFADYLAQGFDITHETTTGRAARLRKPVQVVDFLAEPGMRVKPAHYVEGVRTVLAVPMLRGDSLIGVIVVWRREVRRFTDAQVELLRTFADQAVIAIEHARLLDELETRNRTLTEALEQQTATSEILRAISQSPSDVQPVFDTIAAAALKLCGARSANVFTFDGCMLHAGSLAIVEPDALVAMRKLFPRPVGDDLAAGRAILRRGVVAIPDVLEDPHYAIRSAAVAAGFRSVLSVPLMREGSPIGAIAVGRPEPGPIPAHQIGLLQTFADQAVIAIENVRLFHELEEKSRQLEIASRHKSEFLASMSHELRTPLNAIIGFTRIVMRRSHDRLEHQQYENLEKILASGLNLLSLINAILDLAKVEAGRIDLEPAEVEVKRVLHECMRTVEPLVKDRVSLVKAFDGALPDVYADEEKLRQIVTNLLSNAARFTPQGTIRTCAREVDGSIEIEIADTGIGISADNLDLIFEEFEQANSRSARQYGGTGLGLAISRRLARLMGGDIRVTSEPGAGSTFTLSLPVRYRPPPA